MKREEAIKLVKRIKGAMVYTEEEKEALEILIPELRESESEDENFRKYILKVCKECVEANDKGLELSMSTTKRLLVYLEKQKAKERLDRMAPIYNDKESFESALEKAWKYYNESASRKVDSFEDDYIECVFSKGFREGFLYKEKQKEPTKEEVEPITDGLSTEFQKQVSYLIASSINKEHEYSEGYVKWVSQSLLEYAKFALSQQEKQEEQKENTIEHVYKEFITSEKLKDAKINKYIRAQLLWELMHNGIITEVDYHYLTDNDDFSYSDQKEQKSLLPEDKVKHPLYVEGFEVGKEVGRQYEKVFGKQEEQEHICDSAQYEDGFKTGLEIGLRKQKEQKSVPSREMILGIWELGNFWKESPEARDGLTQLQYIQKHWNEKCDYKKEQKPILEVFGFKVGDAVRLKDGDGRKHIIKSFEEVEGIHGPNFYHVEFEDDSARDGIYPGEEYPNGYYTQMEKFEE